MRNAIAYDKGLEKYLPKDDKSNLNVGERCWYLQDGYFIPVTLKNFSGSKIVAVFDGDTQNYNLPSRFVFSDKTLVEVIKNATIEKSNKSLEMTMKKEQSQFDSVKKPKHYILFPEAGIEVRDLVKLLLNRASANGYSSPMFLSDQAQMLQYILRFDAKNGKEDLEKARWYLDKMIESLSN